jgi:hypothetical protein
MPEVMRRPDGVPFWSNECEDPIKAIEFALEELDDQNDAYIFLSDWFHGSVEEFPEFFKHVGVAI